MEWTESLSVGVDVIDNQHKELIERVNRFYESIKKGQKKEEILGILEFLDQYVKTHFSDEEKLQLKYGYPGYIQQKNAHAHFIGDIAKIKKDIQANGVTAGTALVVGSTLSNWLITHISKMDRELGRYLRTRL